MRVVHFCGKALKLIFYSSVLFCGQSIALDEWNYSVGYYKTLFEIDPSKIKGITLRCSTLWIFPEEGDAQYWKVENNREWTFYRSTADYDRYEPKYVKMFSWKNMKYNDLVEDENYIYMTSFPYKTARVFIASDEYCTLKDKNSEKCYKDEYTRHTNIYIEHERRINKQTLNLDLKFIRFQCAVKSYGRYGPISSDNCHNEVAQRYEHLKPNSSGLFCERIPLKEPTSPLD